MGRRAETVQAGRKDAGRKKLDIAPEIPALGAHPQQGAAPPPTGWRRPARRSCRGKPRGYSRPHRVHCQLQMRP